MHAEKNKALSREAFLNRAIIKEVLLPDGAVVCVRALPASFIVAGATNTEEVFATANLLVCSLCDANGALLFTEAEKDRVLSVDHTSLKVILDAILDLNGLRPPKEGEERAARKN